MEIYSVIQRSLLKGESSPQAMAEPYVVLKVWSLKPGNRDQIENCEYFKGGRQISPNFLVLIVIVPHLNIHAIHVFLIVVAG